MKDFFLILIAFGGLVASIYSARQAKTIASLRADNERLKRRLRLWLQDTLALYQLEEMMGYELLNVSAGDKQSIWSQSTIIGIKRFFRDKLRKSGKPSPSERCTPKKIEEELAAL